ncbi:MAG: 1-acyl-sn-glycerol-3-phosphate acyltransferase [Haliea sp.]|nr:1-acyl-sn-glycerol-3-phosphate acyltransferase [Haliea sp.]
MPMIGHRLVHLWRVFAAGFCFVLFGVGGLILGFVVFPTVSLFSRSKQEETFRCRRMVQLSFRGFVWFMTSCGILTWDVKGRTDIQRQGQLIIANHPSLIDIVLLISMIPNATCIVKTDLFRNIFTRGPVRRAGYIPNGSPEKLIEECEAQLKAGASLVVFPEGSRSVQELPLHFKRGAAHLWLRARCEVSLVTITVTPPYLTKHEMWYQVPRSRPHFSLAGRRDGASYFANKQEMHSSISARVLTRQWQDYFKNEITT